MYWRWQLSTKVLFWLTTDSVLMAALTQPEQSSPSQKAAVSGCKEAV
jgi:hypothetical protein